MSRLPLTSQDQQQRQQEQDGGQSYPDVLDQQEQQTCVHNKLTASGGLSMTMLQMSNKQQISNKSLQSVDLNTDQLAATLRTEALSKQSPTTSNNDNSGRSSSAGGGEENLVVLRKREKKPAVPPKPQLDIVRFSMAQARDEMDLDAILSELLEIENQLSSEASSQFILGLPTLSAQSLTKDRQHKSSSSSSDAIDSVIAQSPGRNTTSALTFRSGTSTTTDKLGLEQHQPTSTILNTKSTTFCNSPDTDSAFGDSSSTESGQCVSATNMAMMNGAGRGCRNNIQPLFQFSNSNSYRGSVNTIPSPTNQDSALIRLGNANNNAVAVTSSTTTTSMTGGGLIRPPSSIASSSSAITINESKKLKIREALEKMKEAKMKKVYVKIFLDDGSNTRGILVDERWTVRETMLQLSEKFGIQMTTESALVEEYPHLHIKRIYEDHEFVVENLEDWLNDSKNKLYFTKVSSKFNFVHNPQQFLLTEKTCDLDELPIDSEEWNSERKQALLTKCLSDEGVQRSPDLEGWLFLKADGKKSWKKHYFVLRSSGLYYSPKNKTRGTKDLQCLMTVYNNQIYTCTDWKKKYKAPTEFGFAIKHPRIQMKTSKFIKYICTEDEKSLLQWVTALRITKNTLPVLYKNYTQLASTARLAPNFSPKRVEIPQIPSNISNADRFQTISLVDLTNARKPSSQAQASTLLELELNGMVNSGRFSVLSKSTNGSYGLSGNNDYSPAGHSLNTTFEQNEFNTIKRKPLSSETLSAQQINGFHPSFGHICNILPNSSTITVNKSKVESDSDEELPPPPPVELEAILTKIPNGSVNFRKNVSIAPKTLTKPTSFIPSANNTAETRNLSSAELLLSPRIGQPPPPPPKRSTNTRLQSPNKSDSGSMQSMNGRVSAMAEGIQPVPASPGAEQQRKMQIHANLFAELQMATKLRSERM